MRELDEGGTGRDGRDYWGKMERGGARRGGRDITGRGFEQGDGARRAGERRFLLIIQAANPPPWTGQQDTLFSHTFLFLEDRCSLGVAWEFTLLIVVLVTLHYSLYLIPLASGGV